MNGLKKLVCLLMAIVAVAFAGAASSAPVKQWSISVLPPTFSTATNVSVTITIKNETPNGNSTINSLKLVLPTGYTVDTSGTPPVSTSWPGQLNWTSQSGVIAFSNMSPLKPQSSFTMTAFLNVNTSQAGCTQTAWGSSMAWTGSSFSGDTFLLKFSTGTSVSPNNALAFQPPGPFNVAVGTPVTGSVHATSCGTDASGASATVKMTNSSNAVVRTATNLTNASGIDSFNFPTSALAAGTYTLTASAPNYGTPITTTVTVCGNSLAFTTQPSNIKQGDPVNATVQANSCGTATGGVSVTAQVKDSSGNLVGNSQALTTAADGNVAFKFTTVKDPITGEPPTIPNLGTYTILATATNYSDTTSKEFRIFGGQLNCEPTMPFNFGDDPNGDITQEGYASGERGYWNKDGVSCIPLLYTFTNTILTDNTVHLEWDMSTGQHPAFTYIMTWKTEDVDNSTNATNFGWPVPKRVFVAWTIDSGTQLPNLVPALTCISPNLPAPYAQLTSDIGTATPLTSQNISVTIPPTVPSRWATAPSTTPFSIVMGTERMLVTSVSGSTWTVTRGDGGTTPGGTAPAHLANDYVMSTPLPLDITGTQVPMCVQSHAWQSVGYDPVKGVAQIRYTTRVFDIGDGYVGLR